MPAQLLYRRELRHRSCKLSLRFRDLQLRSTVLHGLFGKPLRFECFGFVEILAAYRRIGKHGDRLRLHFQNASGHEYQFFSGASGRLDAYLSGSDARDERSVSGIDAELTRFAWKHDELGFPRINRLFGADNVDVYGVGHSYCSVFAFSNASSICPTM